MPFANESGQVTRQGKMDGKMSPDKDLFGSTPVQLQYNSSAGPVITYIYWSCTGVVLELYWS